MIVVDTNVIAYLYLEGERSSKVEQLLGKDAQQAAPVLRRSEFRKVLALYTHNNYLSLGQAHQIMREAMLLMQGREYEIVSFHVLELVASSNCSAYDCEFVALAEDLKTSLVTVDKKILKEFSQIVVSLDAFINSQEKGN